jgi:hypothetical protein
LEQTVSGDNILSNTENQDMPNEITGTVRNKRGRPKNTETLSSKKKKVAPTATKAKKTSATNKAATEVPATSESDEDDGFQPTTSFQNRRNMIISADNAGPPKTTRRAPIKK